MTQTAAPWAGLSAPEALAALGSRRAGLTAAEARERLDRYGPNVLPSAAPRRWLVELAADFAHLFAVLLWVAAALAWVAGMPELAAAIVVVIAVNGLFSYWQEHQAERAAQALRALLPHEVSVRRDGREQSVSTAAVVPGDVLVLHEGDAVPADARCVLSEQLRVDMSSLTGESRPIPRVAHAVDGAGRATAALSNLVLAGTAIASGRGEAVVFATAAATEFGRIAHLTQIVASRPSPLQVELGRVTRLVTILAVALGVGCFAVAALFTDLSLVQRFLFAVGIIVANVPEGLLPTLTLALALGVRRMAVRHALVKRLSAVETLGATTVILTDKTGTITENDMRVREAWWSGRSSRLVSGRWSTADGHAAAGTDLLLRVAALCCDARIAAEPERRRGLRAIGDPTEAAIVIAAAERGLDEHALAAWPRLAELPFDSVRKRMTTIQRWPEGLVACVKGAPSEVLPRCTAIEWDGEVRAFDSARQREAQVAHDALAGRGLRVLAVAMRHLGDAAPGPNGWRADQVERGLTLIGFLVLDDPPRPEVPAALAACRRAGVRVVMITGDSELTGAAIGREIGLYGERPRILTGNELEGLSNGELERLVDEPELLCARVSPEHKLRLVEAFQRRGAVVAVTGDGVNDAPALKRADIGVAMGATGTDVAREAADMVLADDNFANIAAAIEAGRGAYDNVRKFATYIFASNIPEIVPFVAFVLFGIPLPLTVMQILAVDLGTDLLPALGLGMEAPEPDVMQRRPRSRRERLLNLPTLWRAYGWLGAIEAVLSLGGFFFAYWLAGWRPGAPLADHGPLYATATTMSLAGIVACQVGNVFACRSSAQSIFRLGVMSNRMVLVGVAVELALLAVLIYTPPLAHLFGLAPLGPWHWLVLATFPVLLLALEEARKAFRRHRAVPSPHPSPANSTGEATYHVSH